MAVYSIKDIEKLSGIKAHTIRIWEKRYGIVTPKRTETNIRYYLDEDLKSILDIAFLNKKGYKISHLAKMCSKQISCEIAKYTDALDGEDDTIDALIFSIISLDEYKFDSIVNHHMDEKGLEKTMDEIIYPLLDRIMVMWMTGSVKGVHENFVIGALRRKLICEIDKAFKFLPEDAPRFIIYLSDSENQELSLLFLHYLLISEGIRVMNLGVGVPLIDVIECHQIFKSDCVFTMFNEKYTEEQLSGYLDDIHQHLGDCNVLISGFSAITHRPKLPSNISRVENIRKVKEYARNLVEAH